eukprot:gene6184-6819_t
MIPCKPRYFLLTCVLFLWIIVAISLYLLYHTISIHHNNNQQDSSHDKIISHTTTTSSSSNSQSSLRIGQQPPPRKTVLENQEVLVDDVLMVGKQSSPFAYVTLLHGIDESLSYRGFLYNAILMKHALERLGSTADFLVLVGFTSGQSQPPPTGNKEIIADLELLVKHGLQIVFLPRLKSGPSPGRVEFHEMALLKILPWGFTRYEKVQFMDGDVLPRANMDCLFNLSTNTFNTGTASPLNSGWYLSVPNLFDYETMRKLGSWRVNEKRKWDVMKGWGTPIPSTLNFRGQDRPVKQWTFNGASLDQGLCTHHFVLHEGRVTLLDTTKCWQYGANYVPSSTPLKNCLAICNGKKPMDMFYHFTGRNKPWLQENLSTSRDPGLKAWAEALSELHDLNISAQLIENRKHDLKPALGFFYPNK